jgi:hypothetical protein
MKEIDLHYNFIVKKISLRLVGIHKVKIFKKQYVLIMVLAINLNKIF